RCFRGRRGLGEDRGATKAARSYRSALRPHFDASHDRSLRRRRKLDVPAGGAEGPRRVKRNRSVACLVGPGAVVAALVRWGVAALEDAEGAALEAVRRAPEESPPRARSRSNGGHVATRSDQASSPLVGARGPRQRDERDGRFEPRVLAARW